MVFIPDVESDVSDTGNLVVIELDSVVSIGGHGTDAVTRHVQYCHVAAGCFAGASVSPRGKVMF